MQDCVPVDDRRARYQTRFAQLSRALDRNSLDFECVHAKLHTLLDPLPFDADIARHLSRFTGRQWVFDRIDAWLADPAASRVFWITGAPGVGKTAIAAWLCEHRPEVVAFHLCRHGHVQKSDPRRCVLSIAYQLSTQSAKYQDRLNQLELKRLIDESDARTLFDRLIVQPLSGNFPRPQGVAVVLIDGLDEATAAGRNELAEFLGAEFRRTPDWLRLIVTSRPDPEVTHPLQAYTPHVLNASSQDNEEDIRAFLHRELGPPASVGVAMESAIEAILRRSEGIFLYVEWVRQEVEAGRLTLAEPDKFPKGLGEVYAQYVARQFCDVAAYRAEVAPALDAIAAARDPMELSTLATMFGWGERRRNDFRQSLGSLFAMHGGRILPFHKAVIDWLTDAEKAGPYFVSVEDGHGALAAACWKEYRQGIHTLSPYALRNLPAHLIAAKRWEDLETLLTDLPFLEAKAAAGLVFELAGDFASAVKALPADCPGQRILKLLEEALRRDIHFIARHARDYPQALFQCLWNTCWWYDCDEAAAHYVEGRAPGLSTQEVEAGWRPALPSSTGRGVGGEGGRNQGEHAGIPLPPEENQGGGYPTRLCHLLEQWRRQKEAILPGFLWLRSLRPPFMHLGSAQLAVLRGHEGPILSVAFSPGGDRIVSGSSDKTVRVWNARSGAELTTLRGHESSVNSVVFSPDGDRIVSGSSDRTVRVWNAWSGAELAVLRGHEGAVRGVALSPGGDRIVSGSEDGTLRIWSGGSGAELAVLRGHESGVHSVAFSAGKDRIVSGALDRTVRVWDASSGAELNVLRGHEYAVYGVAYSPDVDCIVSGATDKTVRLWHADSGAELAVFRGHKNPVWSVAFSASGRWIASGSEDRTVRICDVKSGAELTVLRGHEGSVTSVAISPRGDLIASGSWDHTVRIWDTERFRDLAVLRGHESGVHSVAFSPKGDRIASGASDKTVRVWDTWSGMELAALRGHTSGVRSVAFSPEGGRITSGASDKTVRVWDVNSGVALAILFGHESWVRTVSFSFDGKRLVSGAFDGTVRVWDANSGECLEVISGAGEIRETMARSNQFPFRVLNRGLESVVVQGDSERNLAWFPIDLRKIAAHPTSRIWAGAVDKYLCLIALEG